MDRNQNLNLFMRNFADVVRLPEPIKRKLDLHQLIKNVTTLMELKAGEKEIDFKYNLSPRPIFITCDELQLEQALINIIKNAIEAIERKGTINFATTDAPQKLVITDTGKGIEEKHAVHLFSPFFSTKIYGQGIGLTLIKEILLNHHYEFTLTTREPGRTEFAIKMQVD